MKCKDIPDQVFLDAVNETKSSLKDRSPDDLTAWRCQWDVLDTLRTKMGIDIPERLFLAKAAKLIARKLMYGCACGCRGDFHTQGDEWEQKNTPLRNI